MFVLALLALIDLVQFDVIECFGNGQRAPCLGSMPSRDRKDGIGMNGAI